MGNTKWKCVYDIYLVILTFPLNHSIGNIDFISNKVVLNIRELRAHCFGAEILEIFRNQNKMTIRDKPIIAVTMGDAAGIGP